MILRYACLSALIATLCLSWGPLNNTVVLAEDPVFSGPQIDEKLPNFKAIQLVGESKGQEFDVMAQAKDAPVVIIFFHKLTRPAFGLTRVVQQYALGKADKPLHSAVVILSDDPNETMQARFLPYFPSEALVGVSPDGIEGPGAYGLNRNVELTILVGQHGKVTDNFALVQPSLPADGPKILQAIADLIGEQAPSLEQLQEQNPAMNTRMRARRNPSNDLRKPGDSKPRNVEDTQLVSMLRRLIREKQASEVEVRKTVEAIQAHIADDERAQADLAQRASRIVKSGRLDQYGNKHVQAAIEKWAESIDD